MRLLIDPPADGVTNMARDEALLIRVGQQQAPPTLRLYRWDPPTISLGYFQPYADYQSLQSAAGELPVVRRTTGGGAILHDREWTYSVTLPRAHALVADCPACLYEVVHDALIDALALLRVSARRCGQQDPGARPDTTFFCFERRHPADVLLGDGKLAGSAQRRTRRAILQHGSIILANRFPEQQAAALGEALNMSDEDLLQPLLDALAARFGEPFDQQTWTAEERQLAESLKSKYSSAAWTTKATTDRAHPAPDR